MSRRCASGPLTPVTVPGLDRPPVGRVRHKGGSPVRDERLLRGEDFAAVPDHRCGAAFRPAENRAGDHDAVRALDRAPPAVGEMPSEVHVGQPKPHRRRQVVDGQRLRSPRAGRFRSARGQARAARTMTRPPPRRQPTRPAPRGSDDRPPSSSMEYRTPTLSRSGPRTTMRSAKPEPGSRTSRTSDCSATLLPESGPHRTHVGRPIFVPRTTRSGYPRSPVTFVMTADYSLSHTWNDATDTRHPKRLTQHGSKRLSGPVQTRSVSCAGPHSGRWGAGTTEYEGWPPWPLATTGTYSRSSKSHDRRCAGDKS